MRVYVLIFTPVMVCELIFGFIPSWLGSLFLYASLPVKSGASRYWGSGWAIRDREAKLGAGLYLCVIHIAFVFPWDVYINRCQWLWCGAQFHCCAYLCDSIDKSVLKKPDFCVVSHLVLTELFGVWIKFHCKMVITYTVL